MQAFLAAAGGRIRRWFIQIAILEAARIRIMSRILPVLPATPVYWWRSRFYFQYSRSSDRYCTTSAMCLA
jgi:hypothetical protein